MLNAWQRQDLLKRRFTLPNELFSLGLTTAEISIYTYLLYIEDRKTHQCWPSYKTIGKAVKLSNKTVKKYVAELVNKGLNQYGEHHSHHEEGHQAQRLSPLHHPAHPGGGGAISPATTPATGTEDSEVECPENRY